MPRRNKNARARGKWHTTKQKGRDRGKGSAMKARRQAASKPRSASTKRAA